MSTGTFPDALPAPRTPDPLDAPELRWGVLGTGWIAGRFVAALQRSTRQRVVAVGSRAQAGADRAAAQWGARSAHGSYEALVGDPDVDVVYVATPHPAHLPCARLALEAGKHVLVEKPLAVNAREGQEIADLARARGLFCMEALWTAFLPRLDVVRQLLEAGALGQVGAVLADHGQHFEPDHRVMSLDLAGGPMLDLGTYPVSFATWVLGPADSVHALGQPAPTGVNGQTAAVLGHAGGRQSLIHSTVLGVTPTQAVVVGDAATLVLPGPFYMPGDVVLTSCDGGRSLRWSEPQVEHKALHFQAAEVARCIATGRTESPLRTLEDSLVTLRAMDGIRYASGEIFPWEPPDLPADPIV